MIAKLQGIVDLIEEDWGIMMVQGVGYQVFASQRTLRALPDLGQGACLWIEYLIRNEQPQLFGFITREEQAWFRLLTTVQGVGAKVALAILSVLTETELTNAILLQDQAMITRADGVGPKLAARIISELKDKVGKLSFNPVTPATIAPSSAMSDAISALLNLGYKRPEIVTAIAQVTQEQGPDLPLDELIRRSLPHLAAKMRA